MPHPIIHRCMAPGCTVEVSGDHLTCSEHWYRLPKEIQKAVSEPLNGWRSIPAAREFLNLHYRQTAKPEAIA